MIDFFGLFRKPKQPVVDHSDVTIGSVWVLACNDGNPFADEGLFGYTRYTVVDVKDGWVKFNGKFTVNAEKLETFKRFYSKVSQ